MERRDRERDPMITKQRLLRMVGSVGLVGLLATGCAGATDASDPGVVTAVFADASPLLPGFTVRSHGVQIGEVDSVSVRNGQAWVRMRLDGDAARPLHTDATAKIRPVSLLGERYIDFDRGSPTAPVAPLDDPIPIGHTASAVDLSDVLNTVDHPTGTALAAMVSTLGDGTRSRGQDIDAAIAQLAPSLHRTDGIVTLLNQQNAVLADLIDKASPVARAAASNNGQDLDRMLSSTELLLRTTAADQAAVDAALRDLPKTLADARGTLSHLAGVSREGTTTLGNLRPFTDALPPITGELQDFSDAADPALASLDPVLKHGRDLIEEAAPLVRRLRPAGPDLRSVSDSARPVVTELTDNLGTVLGFFRNWSMVCNAYDGLSNYFRGLAVITPTQGTGLLPSAIASKVPPLPGPIDGTGSKVPPVPMLGQHDGTSDPGNVTGLDPSQEQGLMHQLVGGG